MKIGGRYAIRNADDMMQAEFPAELAGIEEVIKQINAHRMWSEQATQEPRLLGAALGEEFQRRLRVQGWQELRVEIELPTQYYVGSYAATPAAPLVETRTLDFVRNRVNLDLHFNDAYAPLYSGSAKMTIFHNLSAIDVGVEIVPLKELADQMSTGVSYFEQFVWDLQHRGEADIDIPVLILGIVP